MERLNKIRLKTVMDKDKLSDEQMKNVRGTGTDPALLTTKAACEAEGGMWSTATSACFGHFICYCGQAPQYTFDVWAWSTAGAVGSLVDTCGIGNGGGCN